MIIRPVAAALSLALPTAAAAEENRLEAWFEGAVRAEIGHRSYVEFQTQQRERSSSNPAGNSHIYRLWLGRKFGQATLSGGVHRSVEGTTRETRLIEQASYPLGLGNLKGRTRLEQRLVDRAEKTGWRLRQRVGLAVPLTKSEGGWELSGNAEGFLTLRATSRGGQTGLTGLRTFIGFERAFGRVDLSIGYTRQQTIRRDAPDRVGHAPTLGLTLNL